mgnify:CR=1 FL=1
MCIRDRFRTYFGLSDTYPAETEGKVIDLLVFARQAHYKDPTAARIMSYILPGSGQMYAGDLFQGLNSLLVTGLAGALVVWALLEEDYLDAVLAMFFVFQRFYFGSPYHARRLALEYNDNREGAVQRAILRLLE